MRIMLDCSPAKIAEYSQRYGYEFWQLRTPLTKNRVADTRWALDNGCFSQFDQKTWTRMLNEADDLACRLEKPHPPVFVTLPDLVGSAQRTRELFDVFFLQTVGLPRAMVLQDGIGSVQIPWSELAAVFVGGSDAFKVSQEARDVCRVAKMLGKWVHVGRVNTASRVRDWLGLADSLDGSGISRFDHMLEDVLMMIRGEHPQVEMLA